MITFREIAVRAGIPESTLRQYRDEFEAFLPSRGEGRRRRYDDTTAELLCQIAQWKAQGWGKETVQRELTQRQTAAPQRRTPHTSHPSEVVRLLQEQARALERIEADLRLLRTERRSALTPLAYEDALLTRR